MTFSIDGLASGLDTTSIIRQLMTIERQPQVRLMQRQAQFNAKFTAWGQIDTAVNDLHTKLKALREVSDFNEFLATSSDESVFTATASSAAASGQFSFTVEQLAAAHQQISSGFSATTDLVGAGIATFSSGLGSLDVSSVDASTGGLANGAYDITVNSVDTGAGTAEVNFNGTTQTVSITGTVTLTSDDGDLDINIGTQLTTGQAKVTVVNADASTTLSDLRTAINNANGDTKATIINTGNGTEPYKLVVNARETGTDNALTLDVSGLSGFTAGFSDLKAASDAELTIGGGAETITRSTNNISDLLEGVTINLVSALPGTEVTIDVKNDTEAVVDKVQDFVDALNRVFSDMDKHAKYNLETEKGGPLVGDSRIRTIDSKIRTALGYSDTDLTNGYLSSLGISVDREGRYSLDQSKLTSALESDFTGVVQYFTEDVSLGRKGLMGTLDDALDPLTQTGGLLDSIKEGTQSTVDDLQDSIDAWDDRLVSIEARYRKQFSALETALAQLTSQGSFLASQLAGLQ